MRHQSGYIWRENGVWFGRYRTDALQPDGTIKRVQKATKLADYCDRYRTESDVRPLLDDILRPLNKGKMNARSTMTLTTFVEEKYLPGYVSVELKASTQDGYRKLWGQRLQPLIGNKILRDVTPKHISDMLKALRDDGLGRRSISHAKNLVSGIFAYAVGEGLLERNPVREVKTVKTPSPPETYAATLSEVLDMLDALKGNPRAQAAIALTYFAGLRPGEARGVSWEDVEPVHNSDTQQFEWRLMVRRSVWRKHTTAPKTDESVKFVPVIEPLRTILFELRTTEGNPKTGAILRGQLGKALNLDWLARQEIKPRLAAKKIKWHGYYSLRRGIGTLATADSKDALAAKGLLRHASVATTTAHYIKDVPENTRQAMQLVEQRALALIAKRAVQEQEQKVQTEGTLTELCSDCAVKTSDENGLNVQ